jgi:hypothetical protein
VDDFHPNFIDVSEVDQLFEALTSNEHLPEDIKRKLYFL